MEFLINYGEFLAKTVTLAVAVALVIGSIIAGAAKAKQEQQKGRIRLKHLNETFRDIRTGMLQETLSKGEFKQWQKEEKKRLKAKEKKEKSANNEAVGRTFVIDFDGDIKASAAEHLRREVSAILLVARDEDEVLVRLESPGGVVHGYGLAASQLQRIRDRGLKLTAAVDKVAASGGYMMACVADHIIAAPFAIVGSIGVLAQIPNFNRWLKKHDVDYEQFMAGEYKRTVTIFGENDDKARAKFQTELDETHVLFKQFVQGNRRKLDIDSVATGEHWYGQQAVEKALVDEIRTSDDYLMELAQERKLYCVQWEHKKSLPDKLGVAGASIVERFFERIGRANLPG